MTQTTRAALWMIGAIFSFTSMAIAGRVVAATHNTFEIMFFRSLLGIIVVVALAYGFGTVSQITRRKLGLHLIRNLSHFAGQNLWFFALPLIPLAQLFALEFTSPIWVVLLAPIFLGERLTWRKALIAVLGFIGVLIVARPDMSALHIGVLAGAAAAIGFAGSAIATRKLTQTETITCIMFYLTVMQATFAAVILLFLGEITWPTLQTTPWLVLIGLAGLCAHFCLTQALSLAPASVVMPVDFLRLPIIAGIGVAFYDERLDIALILGAALILMANYLNVTQKPIATQK